MEAILTEQELNTLSKKVADALYDRILKETVSGELQKACEIRTKSLIDYYLAENHLVFDARKTLEPILNNYLKETMIIEDKLKDFTSTEHFKKLQITQLQSRIWELQRQKDELLEDGDYEAAEKL